VVAQPFSNVPLGGSGFERKLTRRLWAAGRKRFVQSQLVTDADECSMKRRSKIDDSLAEEFIESACSLSPPSPQP
jgi:hypothetical protein